MSNQTSIAAEELRSLGLSCNFNENLYTFIQNRFSYMNEEGKTEYDFEDLSVEEIVNEYLGSYDWKEIWNNTIFDLVYLFFIKLFYYLGIPYHIIINQILNDYEYIYNEFEDIYVNERPCLYPIIDDVEKPIDIIKPDSTGKIAAKWFSCTSMIVRDGIESLGNCIEAEELADIFETYCREIENDDFDVNKLLEEFYDEGTLTYSLQSGVLQEYSNQYIKLLDLFDENYESGNNYLNFLISRIQFKYIIEAILLEEITEYSADYCESTALYCDVYDRSGWYEFKIVELTEEIDKYNFNPQYSSTIYISLPTENDEELVISGLYHWELELLSLDLPDGQHLMINSPKRESFNEKDVLEIERYLQELNSNKDEEKKLLEDKTVEKNSESVATTAEIEGSVPHAPEGFGHVSSHLTELCESVYGEPVRLIHWQMKDKNGEQQFSTLFRECRRGWYFQMLLTQNRDKWTSEHRVLPSFLNLLEPDETTWAKLTKLATLEDWYALDEIFLNTLIYLDSKVIFAGSDLVGEEVADEAFKNFGFYVSDEDMLPVLLFEAPNLGVRLISYFRHPDGFARENMVSDRNTKGCEVYQSLNKAQQRLEQKLSYYTSEA